MLLHKPKAVLFDWDNTLVDSWPSMAHASNEALSHFNLPLLTLEQIKANAHHSLKDSFPKIFGDKWEQARDVFYKSYYTFQKQNGFPILEQAESTLKLLKEFEIPTALVSNKRGETLRNEVATMDWGHYFFSIIGSADAPRDKPHPDPVYMTLEKIDLLPSQEVWFVGDTTVDIVCAHASGCTPILYGDSSSSPDLAEKNIPFTNVLDHHELLKTLRTFF